MRTLPALLALALAALAPTASAQTFEELRDRIASERDGIEDGELRTLAEFETREAMEALVEAYDLFASAFRRREVVIELKRFDDHEDSFQPALEKLMNAAVGDPVLEVRAAALESLGRCVQNGPAFLALIVESDADDSVRERAMELHVRLSGDSSDGWYRKIYERSLGSVEQELREGDSKKRKGRRRKKDEEEAEEKKPIVWPTQRLRATAMAAIVESLSVEDLTAAVERDRSGGVRRAALGELARRRDRSAVKYAETIFGRPDFPPLDRALAADILLDEQGTDFADELIDVALKAPTPQSLRAHIAGLLVGLDDEGVEKKLVKLVGKGKAAQKVFALQATAKVRDPKFTKKIRKGLRDKQEPVVVATIDALVERRDSESIEDLEKLFEKTKLSGVRAAALRGLSALHDGENSWVARLRELTASEDLDQRNTALAELGRLGRRDNELFLEKLSDPNWSTRLIALGALERLRDPLVVGPIIEQMKEEQGRMSIEFGEALFRLTGQPFGARASAWAAWFGSIQVEDLRIIPEDELDDLVAASEERKLRQISSAAFFGVRIESQRVLFIIDVSGSMNEPMRARYVGELGPPRIDVAKEELVKAVQSLDPGALFNIVAFSGGVDSWLEDGVVGTDDYSREDAQVYIERLGAAGGTNLYGSLEFAFEDPDVDTIFLLSDGEPSVGDVIDPQLIREAIAERNETRGVVINTIAIGADLEVLEWLAEDSGGTHVALD